MSLVFGIAALAVLAAPASNAPQDRAEVLASLVACRAIIDAPARLICYESGVTALEAAERQGDVVVMDRAQVSAARRNLFGFEMPDLPRLMGGAGTPEINEIETSLQSATQTGDGRWVFRLADGSVWIQIDSNSVHVRNRPDQPVRVRRGSVGSFLLTVGDSRAMRVRRQ